MSSRKADGCSSVELFRSDRERILKVAGCFARAKPKGSTENELLANMISTAESSATHLMPLIEAYILGLLQGVRSNPEGQDSVEKEEGGENV